MGIFLAFHFFKGFVRSWNEQYLQTFKISQLIETARIWVPPISSHFIPRVHFFWQISTRAALVFLSLILPPARPAANTLYHILTLSSSSARNAIKGRAALFAAVLAKTHGGCLKGLINDAHFIISSHDEFSKPPGSCNVTTLSNVNKVGVWSNPEGL